CARRSTSVAVRSAPPTATRRSTRRSGPAMLSAIRRRKEGERCGFSFRSIRDRRQRIAVQKLSGAFVARNFDLAEPIPDEAWGKLTTIVLERGQGFICARKHNTTVGQDEIQVRSIVALDPGVRTFVTADAVNPAAI
ncbi:MAG: hypothetical protein OXL68_02860, partial [Paracoccaceae bacterium]|nr:hypothetical protein [Paracoccaceae bacterium]